MGRPLLELAPGRVALRAAVGADDLTRLDDLLEAPQRVLDLLPGLLAEQLGGDLAEWPAGLAAAHPQPYLGPAAAGGGGEADAAGVVDVGALERPPRDALVRHVLGRRGVPLHRLA